MGGKQMSLDPVAQQALQALQGQQPAHQQQPHLLRAARLAAVKAAVANQGPVLSVARVETDVLPRNGKVVWPDGRWQQSATTGQVSVRLYAPVLSGPLPVLLYAHGGGWVTGSLLAADDTCRILARQAGIAVLSVDYRLAPEVPFPGALEDLYAALQWVQQEGAAVGLDPHRVAVAGDSSGGNLAAVATLLARQENLPLQAQVLLYPVTDQRCNTPSYEEFAEGYNLTRADMQWYWQQYLGDFRDMSALASPLQAPDLSNLPRALVITCEYDPLRDEGEAYATRLQQAGVSAVLQREQGMIHGFMGNPWGKHRRLEALARVAEFLRDSLA
ncbi:alpha/beta hydrolase [Alicyclobacillaceae bacterium I2511]|nr:alpha/beta hydrolase [Alicyclobacillaceae bacterium I2511]